MKNLTSNLYNTPLLINQQGFSTLIERSNKLDLPKVDEKTFFSLFSKKPETEDNTNIVNGVGIVEITGVIQQKEDVYTRYFGDSATEGIKREIKNLLANSKVDRILLKINSPGGTVPGVMDLANFIHTARGEKEIIAHVDSLAASAAYWVASACSRIYHAEDTSSLGSIGVYIMFFEQSKYLEQRGVKVNEIKSSEYKTLGSPFRELSTEERKQVQLDVDLLQDMFAGDVANFRGIEKEKVMGFEARVFRGTQAIKHKLSDGKRTLEEIIMSKEKAKVEKDELTDEEKEAQKKKEQAEKDKVDEKEKAAVFSAKSLREKEIAKAAALAERERISEINEITQPGLESFMQEQINSGASVAESALAQTKEMQSRGITISAIKKDSPNISVNNHTADNTEQDFAALVPKNLRKQGV